MQFSIPVAKFQHDHVRRYGPDYKDRLMEPGFSVAVDGFVRGLDDRATSRFGREVSIIIVR